MIDWKVAAQTAHRLSRPGPDLGPAEVAEVVAELREAALRAQLPVREYTGLDVATEDSPVLVVDRQRWSEANLESFAELLTPVVDKLASRAVDQPAWSRAVGSRVSGAEVGVLLSFLSSKVLGQFDPFWPDRAGAPGRLLLVAPNVVEVERQLDVDPHDFRLWVCLHEQAHRLQFTAVPWLRDHLRGRIDEFTEQTDLDASALARALGDGAGEVLRILRGESDASLGDLFHNDQQRRIVEEMTGVMSLLEGHADVVMDGVGPEVVPTVADIRRKFERRRQGRSTLDRAVRRLLGLESKMRQYRDGAVFVREVQEAVGREGFNAVWAAPAHLPSRSEILEPSRWLRRVHG